MTTLKLPCHVRVREDGIMGNMLADTLWLAKRKFERRREQQVQQQIRTNKFNRRSQS